KPSIVGVDPVLGPRKGVRVDVPANLRRRVAHEWAFINTRVLEADHLLRNSHLAHPIPDEPIHRLIVSVGKVNDIDRWLTSLCHRWNLSWSRVLVMHEGPRATDSVVVQPLHFVGAGSWGAASSAPPKRRPKQKPLSVFSTDYGVSFPRPAAAGH